MDINDVRGRIVDDVYRGKSGSDEDDDNLRIIGYISRR